MRPLHHVEHVSPGVPSPWFDRSCCSRNPPSWVYGVAFVFLYWPLSSVVFLLVLGGQQLAPLLGRCLGNAWCNNATQISFTHSMRVVWHTIKQTWTGWLCCCGCCVKLEPAVLFAAVHLATPPRFIFDEAEDEPVLLTLEDYIEKKKGSFPSYSGQYRAVDGRGNWLEYPFLGQGGRGYAMNSPFQVYTVLPDPEALQAALFMRSTFRPAPLGHNAISSWFANVAIHDFFRTDSAKPWVNLHSGYLDLQVLYGYTQEVADSVRTFEGGKVKNIGETRFDKLHVPGSKAIVILLMKEHNFVCEQLANRYPAEFHTDEKLYQQARLIMGGVYINCILRQYGDQMFGENALNGEGFAELRLKYGHQFPSWSHFRTVGNHSTLNFNLIYRWHAGIPETWKPNDDCNIESDDALRKVFLDAYEHSSGGFGPNNVPAFLSSPPINVEAAGIKSGRRLGAPRLNDFRRRFGNPYKSFMDMCGDENVAAMLERFYPSVEDVELYVGVNCERAMYGGWLLSDTAGSALLADAFNSIRQDRFYTDGFTPEAYTKWGYEHAKATNLTDILNRHLDLGLDRCGMLSRLPGWQGAPKWQDMEGYPLQVFKKGFDARGAPVLAKSAGN
eukprot:TRINITY_DN658_c0_g1_i2.p1 TRINITY_DN658_c0_g1~~TRINITY_DN658_c0_g1_i2.p1  ORF type:complete len:639 (-),score=91.28 TRINITY_DN658_c0_g1_i2:498-2339(-)